MLLFKEQQTRHRDQAPTDSKRLRFRKEIRQTSLKARFEEVRSRLVQDLHSQVLQNALQRLSRVFDKEQFKNIVELLEGNCNSVQFNTKMAEQKLQELLVDVLLANNQQVTLQESTSVIYALSHLTYFSHQAIHNLIGKESFFDYLRRALQGLHMDSAEELPFFNQSLSLLMNIASELKHDFNLFLAESDLSLIINQQLVKTIVPRRNSPSQHYAKLVDESRDYALRLFTNVVNRMEGEKDGDVVARLAGDVLKDQENLLRYPYRTFLFLAECMGNDKFWPLLMAHSDSSNYFVQVCQAFDAIQQRCYCEAFLNNKQEKLTIEESKNFYGAICFLNQLFYEDDDYELAFVSMIENMLNGYMLGEFIIEAYQAKEKDNLTAGIKLVWHLSRTSVVTAEQLVIVRPADDPLQLLKVIMDPQLLTGRRTGHHCLYVLQVILKKDPIFMRKMMELRVLDKLIDVLQMEGRGTSKEVLEKALELATEIFLSAKALGEESGMVGIMGQKGIIDIIEKFADHKQTSLYVKAEEFMEAVSEERKRHA